MLKSSKGSKFVGTKLDLLDLVKLMDMCNFLHHILWATANEIRCKIGQFPDILWASAKGIQKIEFSWASALRIADKRRDS